MRIKRWFSYLVAIIFGILLGRFLIPKPVEVVSLERMDAQIEMANELSRLMEMVMDEVDEVEEFNEDCIE